MATLNIAPDGSATYNGPLNPAVVIQYPAQSAVTGLPTTYITDMSISATNPTALYIFELLGSDGNYYAPYASGPASAPQFYFEVPQQAVFQNWRISTAGEFQLYNVTANVWHTWFIYNGASAFGPATS